MEHLRDNINQLIKNTLKMEQSLPVQDPRLVIVKKEEEEIDWTSPMLQSQPYPEEEHTEVIEEKPLSAEKNQNFSTEDSIIKRHRTRYTATRIKYLPTRIKLRNFLPNISYTGINKTDFYNENFILDVYILLVKNLNPFSVQ